MPGTFGCGRPFVVSWWNSRNTISLSITRPCRNRRYQSLPRACAPPTSAVPSEHSNSRKATISQYFGSSVCLLCDDPILTNGLCAACGTSRQTSAFSLSAMQRLREKDYTELISLCQSCTGNTRIERDCISMDCPVLYRRVKAFQNLQLVSKWRDALSLL